MTEQRDLFAVQHARRTDPATSKAAARSVKLAAMSLADRILEVLRTAGPATVDEIAHALNLNGHQIGKRTADLKAGGLIEPSHITRPGKSGKQQIVWSAK